MISISDNSRVKVKNESIAKVTKLLKKLDEIDQVKVCHQNEIGDIYFTYGQDSPKRVSISVEGDEGRPSGIFLGTFTTERSTQSYRVNVKMGYLYESKADYLFYVSGNMLYTLPLKKFRLWVDNNLEMFRPEYQVDKISYPAPTFSALRNAMQSIYWHPGFNIIPVMCLCRNPIIEENIGSNGVDTRKKPEVGDYVWVGKQRMQRTQRFLRNVKYDVAAFIVSRPDATPSDKCLKSYYSELTRHIGDGHTFKTPYMGINECVARFKPVDFTNLHPEMGNGVTRDIGWMFFDYDYTQVNEKKSFAPTPMFQLVRMENGLIDFTKGAIRRDSSFA